MKRHCMKTLSLVGPINFGNDQLGKFCSADRKSLCAAWKQQMLLLHAAAACYIYSGLPIGNFSGQSKSTGSRDRSPPYGPGAKPWCASGSKVLRP